LNLQPRNDRVLIRRIDEQRGPIVLTDAPKGLKGTVLAVGPGKWHPGNWEYVVKKSDWDYAELAWEWEPGWRQESSVKPGDTVLFSSKWNDLAGDYYSDLPVGADPMIHLVQEADILAKIQQPSLQMGEVNKQTMRDLKYRG
jgi:co-chaperonin GroES (HSP10)